MSEMTLEPAQEAVKTKGHGTIPAVVPQADKASRKKARLLLIGGILALGALILTVSAMRFAYVHQSTDNAFIDGRIVTMSPKVAGQVTAVRIKDNQRVKAGDLLVEIDPRDYEAKVAEQRGKLAASEAEARRAAADAKRYEEIYRHDEISRQQLDNAQAAADGARATVERERGALAQDELSLSYTKITASETGRITKKSVEPGAYVQTGQALFSIVPEEVWVTANFKETQLAHMRPGQKVTIKVDAYPGRELQGHVDSIQSGTGERFSLLPPENATGNYVKVVQRVPVKIAIDSPLDPDFRLSPGMSVVPSVAVR